MAYSVRQALMDDLPRIQEIYAYARDFMAATGNPDQWKHSYPSVELLTDDIIKNRLYVLWDDTGIHGVFYFWVGEDPTYKEIYGGVWHRTSVYGTIHRIAGDGSGGILRSAVKFCRKQVEYLRIDTHEDNRVMRRALEKIGFSFCGIIYISDGSPRIAYDLI